MSITIVANMSANGRILLAEVPGHEAPPAAMEIFMQVAQKAGNLVLGKKTFGMLQHFPGGAEALFPGIELVVLSGTKDTNRSCKIAGNPGEAVQYLTEKGFDTIAIGGGTTAYNAFLQEGLVTDIYCNIIPVITGIGGILATGSEQTIRFNLAKHQLLPDGIIQLHLSRS